jgi:hypothetical protein
MPVFGPISRKEILRSPRFILDVFGVQDLSWTSKYELVQLILLLNELNY